MPERILKFYTKYFAVWVVVFGVIAYLRPRPFVALKEYNQAFFALTMFGIGAVLEVRDFKRIAERPVIVLIGVTAQFVIMPLGAFVVSRLMGLPPIIAAGLILTGSAPGAMASNVMCYISKADTAYSVSLTTVSTLLCPILTPGLTALLATKVPVPFWAMFKDAMLMIIVPLIFGFAVRHFFNRWVKKIVVVFPAISATFIIFICSLVIALNKDKLLEVSAVIALGVLVLNIFGMSAGYGVGALFRMEPARKRTLSIEIGMQNAGLGSTLALVHLGPEAAIPAALFVFTCIITASVMAAVWQRQKVTVAFPAG
ncbi:MAG: bile acid:sodium symporter family protein [Phycisphaerae bacterium]